MTARVLALVSILGLLPAMVSPEARAAQVPTSALVVALCGGGTLGIPLGGQAPPGSGNAPCCAKGCHSGSNRKRLDRTQ